jgi:hypothetical protein
MSDHIDQQAAVDPLRAPAGRDVVDRVTAERLAPPRLRAVDQASDADRVVQLEAQVAEERAARKKAEAAANEMAVLVARVRTDLAEEQQAREAAEATAEQMAGLIVKEHDRSRALEQDLRLARAQMPMLEQHELSPARKPPLAHRARRVLGR